MPHFARVIRLDESDARVFERAAEPGEWAVSGAFEFANWTEAEVAGKAREALANGWLGLESFGRATVVAVTPATEAELTALTEALALHFVARYGAPTLDAARPVAAEEIAHMREMCDDHPPNTLLLVERMLEEVGVRERFRAVPPRDAGIESFATRGS